MTGNVTQFSSSSHISLGFKRHFLTTDIGKKHKAVTFIDDQFRYEMDRTSTDVTLYK